MNTIDKLRRITEVGRLSIEDDCGNIRGEITRGQVCTGTHKWAEKSFVREAGDMGELIDAIYKDLDLLLIPR